MNGLKVSRFTMAEPLDGRRVVLFNTLTRALGVLPQDVWDGACNGRTSAGSTLDELAGRGFLVPESLNENQVLAHWRTSMSYDLTHLRYVVSPTRFCNMACSYCVHGSRKRPEHMTAPMARRVLDFMISDVQAKRPADVRLDFSGAEAILNRRAMRYLAEGMARFCRGRGADFRTGFISNGLALSESLLQDLKPFGLDTVKVTVSGPAAIHDRSRVDRQGRPTYERIMANLERVASLVRLVIQGQYDPEGDEYRRFPELLDDLAARGLGEYVAEVSFSPVVPMERSASGQARRYLPVSLPGGRRPRPLAVAAG